MKKGNKMKIQKDYKQYKQELKKGVRYLDANRTSGWSLNQVFLAMDMRRLNIDEGYFIFTYK